MKFLHIADLHIGKRFHEISLLEDQKYALRQVIDTAAAEKADAVLIAGDVYDKSAPTSEAMTAFNDFLTALVERHIKVFLISGNHDSDERISYFSSLIRPVGVYASERFDGTLQQIMLEDAWGGLVIHLMPFLKPADVRRFFPERKLTTYEDAVSAVLDNSTVDTDKRNVLLCHQFLTGAEVCESENLAVGGLDNISASLFDAFDYVALGHIHKPQRVLRDTVRYSGSLIKYSFSEAVHKKSITVVEMKEKGDISIRTVPIRLKNDVREITGTIDEIMQLPYSEDYVRVTVTDENVPPDARVTISTVFPNMMKFLVQNSKTKADIDVLAKEQVEDKTVKELFCDFYRLQNNDVAPDPAYLDMIEKILLKLEDRAI